MGRGSPWRGSRDIDKRRKRKDINRAHRNPQPKIPLWKSIQHIYETPEIIRSIFSTGSCLQSDNGVSTSNRPPARNIVMIYPDYHIETYIPKYLNTTKFFFTQIWKTKMLHLQKHSNPILISANTPMTIKPKTLIQYFPLTILNPSFSTLKIQ